MAKRSTAGTATTWPCTAEQILEARASGASWRAVAEACGLSGPSAARKAYTELTGTPHYEAPGKVQRAPRGTGVKAQAQVIEAIDRHPHWDADTDQDDIIAAMDRKQTGEEKGHPVYAHHDIVVERDIRGTKYREEVHVDRITKFAFNDDESRLMVSLYQRNGNFRCFYVDDIVEVW